MGASRVRAISAVILFGGVSVYGQQNIGTAFTYQGYLENGSGPVTDTCDFRFGLWQHPSSVLPADQVGSTQTLNAVDVAGGIFGVTPNFGTDAMNGDARWLAIEVQCPGDAGFTLLTPRVELAPAPHALALPGLYTRQNVTSPNIIGGYSGNLVTVGAVGASISGGGLDGQLNRVTNDYGTIGGGAWNRAGDGGSPVDTPFATVAGGQQNEARGSHSAIGGGAANQAPGDGSAIGGGSSNIAIGDVAFIGGGNGNQAVDVLAVIAGGSLNVAFAELATIAGGSNNAAFGPKSAIGGGDQNRTDGMHSSIGGGFMNEAAGDHSVVGGGSNNDALNFGSTVGGGDVNIASGTHGTISGGIQNRASGESSTVAGGRFNMASATSATVPGGDSNSAAGVYSLAAGRRAKVRSATQVGGGDTDGDEGTFLWADSTNADFQSTGPDQFLVRAAGGMGIGTNAPGSQLDVAGEIRSSGAAGGQLTAYNPNSQAALVRLSWLNDVARLRVGGSGAGSTNGFDFQRQGDSSLMRLLNNGNVGIDTTSPETRLHLVGGSDASLGGGGFLTMGSTTGVNIAIDNNEMMARNNGVASPLSLNTDGGNVHLIPFGTGNVGIGTDDPSAKLHVVGDIVYTGTITDISDERLKQNIAPLENALAKLERLRGVYFNMSDTPDRRDVGLIAQDVQAVLPEAVRVVDFENGYLGVAYPSVIPLLVEAIKDQSIAMKDQSDAMNEKDCEIEELRARLTRLEEMLNASQPLRRGEVR